MSALPLVVVKVGGSLLKRSDFRDRLQRWLEEQVTGIYVLVVGGGELADVLRRWDSRHAIGEEASHWLCIRVLGITALLVSEMLPEFFVVSTVSELEKVIANARRGQQPQCVVFDLEHFLRLEEFTLPPRPLPHRWSVTTDSLAARLAEVIQADELILLKAALAPGEIREDWQALAAAGYVDECFPEIAMRLRCIRCDTLDAKR